MGGPELVAADPLYSEMETTPEEVIVTCQVRLDVAPSTTFTTRVPDGEQAPTIVPIVPP